MSSAFVKLPSTSGTGSYLGIPTAGKGLFKGTKDGMGLRSHAIVARDQSSGEDGQDSLIKLNQLVKLVPPVPLKPKRYTVIVGFNPRLCDYGVVSNPVIFSENDEISLGFKASKNIDLKELDYIFTYYMID